MSDEMSKAQQGAEDLKAASSGPEATALETRVSELEAENAKYRDMYKRQKSQTNDLTKSITEFQERTGFEDLLAAAETFESKQSDSQKVEREKSKAQKEADRLREQLSALQKREMDREIESQKKQILAKAKIKTDRVEKALKHVGHLVKFDQDTGLAEIEGGLDEAVKWVRDEFPEWVEPSGHLGTGLPSSSKTVPTNGITNGGTPLDMISNGLSQLNI